MARTASHWVCQQCGAAFQKWAGRCEACEAWNSLVEEKPVGSVPGGLGKGAGRARRIEIVSLDGAGDPPPRIPTGISELDRVAGGGLVPGSAILIGGDPGIGKSTLLLQAVAALARSGRGCLYVSGEEAVGQVRLRAQRLGLAGAPVKLAAETNLRDILGVLDQGDGIEVAVIDSIQTVYSDTLDSAPGTVAQVRAASSELVRMAKKRGITVILVGHVTKDGQIAGPRVVEHMVDTVLYFEGDRGHQFRILRAVKNRFGATDEIGVFEMRDSGLAEVPNPSSLFLGQRAQGVSGTVVFAGMEGTRPILVEIQALVAPSGLATPRRAVVGWDSGRLAMVMAVLDARCGLALGGRDVYLNVAGGLRVQEPAADLAVAAALVSSAADVPIPEGTVLFGEIGLTGEVRPVSQAEQRLKESAKLGFEKAIVPTGPSRGDRGGMAVREISRLAELVALLAPETGSGWEHDD